MANKKSKVADSTQCAKYLKALADPVRIELLQALQSTEWTVSDLAMLLELDIANVSHHLRVLFHADIVLSRRDGRFIYYQINPKMFQAKKVDSMFDFGCCRLSMPSMG